MTVQTVSKNELVEINGGLVCGGLCVAGAIAAGFVVGAAVTGLVLWAIS